MALGYDQGQNFGDPSGFTRGTGEDELDRFNQFLRAQPWHQQYLQRIGQTGAVNLSERQQKELAEIARANGVDLPADDLSMDQAGNLNQNSRTARNIAIAGIIGAGVLTGGAALGAFGAGGAAAGAGGATGAGLSSIAGGVVPGVATTAIPTFGAAGATAGGGLGLSALGGKMALAKGGLDAAGALAGGRAQGRQADFAAQQQADQARLQAAQYNAQLPGQRAGASVRGDVLAGLQPVSFSGSGRDLSISGGLSPALLSQGSRQVGQQMSREALLSALGQGGPQDPYAQFTPQAQLKGGSALDKALGAAGLIGAGLDVADEYRRRR